MKVAFILPGNGRSGGVRVTVTQGNKLLERGHTVRILHLKTIIKVRDIFRLVRNKTWFKGRSEWLSEFKGRIEGFDDIEEIDFEEGEIVIGVGMWSSFELARLINRKTLKLVQYIHGATPWAPDLMERALRLPIPKVLVASYLKEVVGSYGGKMVLGVVANGIDLGEYFPCVEDERRSGVGLIYSSHPAKDPATNIALVRKLREIRPDIPLSVFGSERKPKGVESAQYWRLPSVRKAREIYSNSVVWIVGSKSEGFSIPVLEAMACGCAVVATDCGGTRDIIVDGVNGFLVPVGDVDQIAGKSLLLLDNKCLRDTIRCHAEDTVKRFNWDSSINSLEKILKTVV